MTFNKDDYIKFHIVKAPIAQVLPLCVGLIRAEHDGAILTRDVAEPPLRYHYDRLGQPDHHDCTSGFLISTPKGRPDLTLIECPPLHSLDCGLEMLDPSLESLTIWSHVENQRVQDHGFELRQNATRVRLAAIEKGMETTRWQWREDGPVLPFEEPLAYEQHSIQKRMTPVILSSYAFANGVDQKRHLIDRELESPVLITFGQVMSPNDLRPRTIEFQEVYERVLTLGIGQPESTKADHEAAREMFAEAELRNKIENKAARAFNRLNAKSDVTVAQVMTWFNKHQKLLQDEFGPDADPFPLNNWAADKATGIDPMHPDSEWLRNHKKSWENVRNAQLRLVQLLPDGQGYSWPSDTQIRQLVRATFKEHEAPSNGLMPELLRGFRELCERHGIVLETDAQLPSTAQAQSSAYAYIVGTYEPKSSQVTMDAEIRPVILLPGKSETSSG